VEMLEKFFLRGVSLGIKRNSQASLNCVISGLGILDKEKGSSVFTWQLNSFPLP
jgi:hypothetical protein